MLPITDEQMFYGGAFLAGTAAFMLFLFACVYMMLKIRLNARLDAEYGAEDKREKKKRSKRKSGRKPQEV